MASLGWSSAATVPARPVPGTILLGGSSALKDLALRVEQVAPTSATVLLLGETGTGKSLVARLVHERSLHHQGPFITVNCAAIPATLLESELFGRERGAYTDARSSQPGRFEVAERGTLFLDEIGELTLETQAKLLRVLQDGTFERLGSTRSIEAQARVVAATNRDLPAEVRAGRFRRDLYFRLNVIPITIPPLRERPDDIRVLATYYVSRLARRHGRDVPRVTEDVMRELEAHSWPGNVRELENVLERALITSVGGSLTLCGSWEPALDVDLPSLALEDVERVHIRRVLQLTHGRIQGHGGAAHLLRLKASTLRSRMQRLGISRATGLGSPGTREEPACPGLTPGA
jgi:transcriptional regulator with GAF, ATPase, and Fis domain